MLFAQKRATHGGKELVIPPLVPKAPSLIERVSSGLNDLLGGLGGVLLSPREEAAAPMTTEQSREQPPQQQPAARLQQHIAAAGDAIASTIGSLVTPSAVITGVEETMVEDNVAMSVVRVELELKCSWPDPSLRGTPQSGPRSLLGECCVVGPPTVLEQLNLLQSRLDSDMTLDRGPISPLHRVTLPPDSRELAGIPRDADFFVYLFALSDDASTAEQMGMDVKWLARNQWAHVLILGGFAYFDANQRLLAVNALSPAPSASGLVLRGAPPVSPGALAALRQEGRMVDITEPSMRGAGFTAMTFLEPVEKPGGHAINASVTNKDGGFALCYNETDATGALMERAVFYSVMPATRELFDAAENDMHAGGTSAGTHLLSVGMRHMTATATAAEAVVEAAGEITTFPRPTQVDEANIHWRGVFFKTFIVQVYVFLGVLFYMLVEDWGVVEAYYFSVVTISTVGYGDYSPSTDGSRCFTGVYALVGISITFGLLGSVVDELMLGLQRFVLTGCSRAMQEGRRVTRTGKGPQAAAGETAPSSTMVNIEPAWQFYMRGVAFYTVFGLVLSLFISAAILMSIEPELDYGNALWHCYITVLTVGYGDVGLTTDSARLFAALHITLSVSWLSGLLGVVSRLKEERATDLKYLQLTSMQLSPKLIDFLDPTGDGVSELEFVFGMLGLMGADLCNVPLNFKQHAQPLIHRSQQLDADNSGILNHQDLEFMMDQMQEAVAPDKMKLRKERAEKIRKFLGKRARHVKVKVVQRNSQDLEKPQEARNFENPARI
jgi:voltage-gated potassium channel Kch